MSTAYYGIITHDTPGGGSHRRLWESINYDDSASASAAVFDEIMTGKYDGVPGIRWLITTTETGGK
jgi:hypothetical protein